jgi:hypothetical protein
MPELNANIPPIHCYVRGNYLRNHKDSHDKYFECVVFGVSSLKSRSPLFHIMMPDGGLWWRLPISAFCTEPGIPEVDLHNLVLWNSFSHHISVTQFENLTNLRMSYIDRTKTMHKGTYLFTLDWHNPDTNVLDDGYSESPADHKCGHVIQRDDGNFAIQPNNRVRVYEPSFTLEKEYLIDRIINERKYDVENQDKWILENSDRFNYDINEKEVDN